MKVKKIYKYGTGDIIPEGAVYLNTVTQTKVQVMPYESKLGEIWNDCWLVWHYFLIEEEDE